jgi:hypothetical protein
VPHGPPRHHLAALRPVAIRLAESLGDAPRFGDDPPGLPRPRALLAGSGRSESDVAAAFRRPALPAAGAAACFLGLPTGAARAAPELAGVAPAAFAAALILGASSGAAWQGLTTIRRPRCSGSLPDTLRRTAVSAPWAAPGPS